MKSPRGPDADGRGGYFDGTGHWSAGRCRHRYAPSGSSSGNSSGGCVGKPER